MPDEEPHYFRVLLKSGDVGYFLKNEKYKNQPDRLISGMYGIIPLKGGPSITITPETVQSIDEVEIDDVPERDR